MTFDNILQAINLLTIVKTGLLILIGLFTVFLFIVYLKINSLSKIVTQDNSTGLKIIIFVLIVLSLSLFLMALVIL